MVGNTSIINRIINIRLILDIPRPHFLDIAMFKYQINNNVYTNGKQDLGEPNSFEVSS